MLHQSSIANRLALLLVAGLSAAAATPAAAQQPTGAGASAELRQSTPLPAPEALSGTRWMLRAGTADRGVLIPVTGLNPAAEVRSAPATPLLGPSLRPAVRGVEPRIAERRVTGPPVAAAQNTIVISTLALVLIAVLVTILVLD